MRITLIDYTGCGHSDPWRAARLLAFTKNTRLEQTPQGMERFLTMSEDELTKELDYISKTIRSSWEFVDFTFMIEGVSRAFTHQLVRTRTASYAQQSQRSVDMSGFDTVFPLTVKNKKRAKSSWIQFMNITDATYKRLISMGIPAQDARGILPTNICTNIIMKCNLRTLADLAGKRENLRAQGEYADVFRAMAEEAKKVMPWIQPFLYPERTRTPALDKLLKDALGSATPASVPGINDALKELDALKEVWG